MIFQRRIPSQGPVIGAPSGEAVERGPLRAAGAAANRYAAAILFALLVLVVWQAVAFLTSVQDWLLPAPTEIVSPSSRFTRSFNPRAISSADLSAPTASVTSRYASSSDSGSTRGVMS